VAVVVAAIAAAGPVAADDDSTDELQAPSGPRRALGVGAALIPGTIAHGAGLYTIGDREGAARLFTIEAIGLAALVAGSVPLGLTGASRKLIWPTVPLVISGAGLFAVSWLADIYGVTGLSARAAPHLPPRIGELELGYGFVHDPLFAYDHFTTIHARLTVSGIWFQPSGWIAVGADNQRWRLESRAPVWRRPGASLSIATAATWHRYGDDGFSSGVAEASVHGRLDLARLSPNLAGAFAELSTGAGIEWLRFDLDDGIESDAVALLLGTFALGARLRLTADTTLETRLLYDHRRDDFAAGFSTRTRGSGFGGHFGGAIDLGFESWALRGEAWVGAARVFRLGVARSFGDPR